MEKRNSMYEHHRQPLLLPEAFRARLVRHGLLAFGAILASPIMAVLANNLYELSGW